MANEILRAHSPRSGFRGSRGVVHLVKSGTKRTSGEAARISVFRFLLRKGDASCVEFARMASAMGEGGMPLIFDPMKTWRTASEGGPYNGNTLRLDQAFLRLTWRTASEGGPYNGTPYVSIRPFCSISSSLSQRSGMLAEPRRRISSSAPRTSLRRKSTPMRSSKSSSG